jgi:20S proteasome subunit beta 1
MAATFKDGVILGADSRTTTGPIIANRVTDKLTMVDDMIWCCRSGSAADTQAVADIVGRHLKQQAVYRGQPPSTADAAAIFSQICYQNKDMLS